MVCVDRYAFNLAVCHSRIAYPHEACGLLIGRRDQKEQFEQFNGPSWDGSSQNLILISLPTPTVGLSLPPIYP
ncbi:MAG: hypothetical protein HC796_04770 [Synechococcaceae cyanobacterium RL_1_2]|nr:hypothetical protein [Synechococcaceae cyanobacterium RL_1_2]